MRLSHLHLPGLTPFSHASAIQQSLVSRLLAHKRLTSSPQPSSNSPPPPPNPTILTFTPHPVYTTGRRDLPPSNTDTTTTTSELSLPSPLEPIRHLLTSHPPAAEYHPTLRGGQTTYHGPGQLVAYTILDLRRLGLTPRTHIRLLENSVLDVLAGYGVEGGLNDDPGVWVGGPQTQAGGDGDGDGDAKKKIAAVGVHLRRNISSYGVGFNVTEEPMGFFRLIVPCGLEGKEATSLEGVGVKGVEVGEVAGRFVDAFVGRLRGEGKVAEEIEGVDKIREEDVKLDDEVD
ncbi:hypothetical protein FQN54_004373 [Arachnomyces sp. PD_36]|nr:hypothetical protein FQN54_004373 [Arachnomyces sp. PD_36]